MIQFNLVSLIILVSCRSSVRSIVRSFFLRLLRSIVLFLFPICSYSSPEGGHAGDPGHEQRVVEEQERERGQRQQERLFVDLKGAQEEGEGGVGEGEKQPNSDDDGVVVVAAVPSSRRRLLFCRSVGSVDRS